MDRIQPTEADLRAAERSRRIFWIIVVGWAAASWMLGQHLSERMRFRINDLASVPGAGYIMRDMEGTFYHVNPDGKARAIYPEVEDPLYQADCTDCMLVTGEQMSQTNDFCASATKDQLPNLNFEQPCKTWAPMGDGQKVMAFIIFMVPLMLYPIARAIIERMFELKAKKKT